MCLKTQVCLCRFVCGRASGVRAGNRDQQEILISCSFHHFQKPLKQGAAQPCRAICSSETALYLCHFNFFLLLLTWRTNSFSVPHCQSVPAAQLLTPVVPDAQFNQWHEIILFSPKPERTAQCMWSAPKTVLCWIFVHLPPSLATSIIKSSLNMLRVHTHICSPCYRRITHYRFQDSVCLRQEMSNMLGSSCAQAVSPRITPWPLPKCCPSSHHTFGCVKGARALSQAEHCSTACGKCRLREVASSSAARNCWGCANLRGATCVYRA